MGNSSSSITEGSIHDFVVKVRYLSYICSKCTNSNYTELAELYTQFKDKVLEEGTGIKPRRRAICMHKIQRRVSHVKVNGANAAPVYKFLKSNKKGHFGGSIKWNFTKFLVDRDGHVINRYGTTTSPVAIAVSLSLSHTPLSLIDTAKFCIALQDDIKKALGDET
ncbi:hypothetical protein SASPL_107193 [Salvia splendens]|uniref:Glutathione peroxidase n=1 Tax=Salvia splendens TaxID=180675 RepID=A0A8X8YFZ9_SALSN|nr:hypothetical protein SASPL_107193 [Salvia splendens]